jgi:hypothetical protein
MSEKRMSLCGEARSRVALTSFTLRDDKGWSMSEKYFVIP